MRDEEMLAEIEDFLEGFNQPTFRGMRINGVRVAVVEPAWLERSVTPSAASIELRGLTGAAAW
jgi:hypothetical protein